jgi:hypothetical protein
VSRWACFGGELSERDHLEDLEIGRDLDWIDLAQDKDNWPAVLNKVTRHCSIIAGNFLTS